MRTVGFTGHRPEKLPWKNNENDERCIKVKENIYSLLRQFAQQQYRTFICGGAWGTDFYFAEAVLKLKELYPNIELWLFLGYEKQGDNWNTEDQKRLENLKAKASIVRFINPEYTENCMLKRDEKIVAWSDLMVSVFDRKIRGGTKYTMKRIHDSDKCVFCINPNTLEIDQLIGKEFWWEE